MLRRRVLSTPVPLCNRKSSNWAIPSIQWQALRRNFFHELHAQEREDSSVEGKCKCKQSILLPVLCSLLPMHRFSNSIYSVPSLLFLRLFYPALSCDCYIAQPKVRSYNDLHNTSRYGNPGHTSNSHLNQLDSSSCTHILHHYEKFTTSDFLTHVQQYESQYNEFKVISVTWVKALASPLSHEFLQFVIEHVRYGTRFRLVADRQESGDLVVVGWDWQSEQYPSHHHVLPLPLLTLQYNNADSQPSLPLFAQLLADVSAYRPYNIMREMCWWYAESIFDSLRSRFPGKLKEWPFAKLRYSFVVRTSIIQRKKLSAHAQAFRELNRRSMRY